MDLTHTWSSETRWQPKVPAYVPPARAVNLWSISGGMGHDSINAYSCIRAACERKGVSHLCAVCAGETDIWPSEEAKSAYDAWEPTDPPAGDGYQIWETVSEGSPISPVFSTPEALARHMAGTKWGADDGTPYDVWLKFIRGPGWAPSMIMSDGVTRNGVEGVVSSQVA